MAPSQHIENLVTHAAIYTQSILRERTTGDIQSQASPTCM